MPTRPRHLLAIRLVGPVDIVTTQKTYLTAYLAKSYGPQAVLRTSTHPARHAGEIRVYLTVTPKGDGG